MSNTVPTAVSYRLLADTYTSVRRLDDAEHILREGLLQYPNDSATHSCLALVLIGKEHYAGAMESAVTALQLDPTNYQGHYALALVHKKQGNVDAALAICRRALEQFPRNVILHREMSDLFRLKLNFDEALRYSEQAVALDPRDVRSLVMHSNMLINLQRLESARQAAEQALVIEPNHPDALMSMGYISYCQQEISTAQGYFRRVLQLVPGYRMGQLALIDSIRMHHPIYQILHGKGFRQSLIRAVLLTMMIGGFFYLGYWSNRFAATRPSHWSMLLNHLQVVLVIAYVLLLNANLILTNIMLLPNFVVRYTLSPRDYQAIYGLVAILLAGSTLYAMGWWIPLYQARLWEFAVQTVLLGALWGWLMALHSNTYVVLQLPAEHPARSKHRKALFVIGGVGAGLLLMVLYPLVTTVLLGGWASPFWGGFYWLIYGIFVGIPTLKQTFMLILSFKQKR